MGEVYSALLNRRSIRKFKADMVPKELIEQVMEAGIYAASGRGGQSPIVIAITNKEVRDDMVADNAKIGGWDEGFDPFYGAPVILMVLAPTEAGTRVYDGSLMLGNMMLAADDLGLGSVWIHRAKQELEMEKWQNWLKGLGLDGTYEGIGHLALGYADCEKPAAAERKPGRKFFCE